jgi:hypothetical protein
MQQYQFCFGVQQLQSVPQQQQRQFYSTQAIWSTRSLCPWSRLQPIIVSSQRQRYAVYTLGMANYASVTHSADMRSSSNACFSPAERPP